MGRLLKLHLSSYVARNALDFSITANVIVLFLLRVMKDILIIYLSFLNCDWLLIRGVQWFYWTQELLVPVEKFTVRMRMVSL